MKEKHSCSPLDIIIIMVLSGLEVGPAKVRQYIFYSTNLVVAVSLSGKGKRELLVLWVK